MPDCEYCGASFGDEDALVAHLGDEHYDELGRIDRRRVDDRRGGEGGDLTVYLALGGGLALFAIVVYFLFFAGGAGPGTANGVPAQPYDLGSVHEHGTINVTIRGVQVDFSRPEYQIGQTQNRYFHFEAGTTVWHVHGRGVTLRYAMATLGIGVTEDSVTFEGVTYNDSDPGTTVVVEVDGEPVDPAEHVLRGVQSESNAEQGQHVRIVVRVDES